MYLHLFKKNIKSIHQELTELWQFYRQHQIILYFLVWQTHVKKTIKQLDQMQLTFIDLAQQVHNIHATVDYETSEVDEPPFDRYCYIWNWNGITIRFCGSNYYFHIIFDFSHYISPACAQYSLVIH